MSRDTQGHVSAWRKAPSCPPLVGASAEWVEL